MASDADVTGQIPPWALEGPPGVGEVPGDLGLLFGGSNGASVGDLIGGLLGGRTQSPSELWRRNEQRGHLLRAIRRNNDRLQRAIDRQATARTPKERADAQREIAALRQQAAVLNNSATGAPIPPYNPGQPNQPPSGTPDPPPVPPTPPYDPNNPGNVPNGPPGVPNDSGIGLGGGGYGGGSGIGSDGLPVGGGGVGNGNGNGGGGGIGGGGGGVGSGGGGNVPLQDPTTVGAPGSLYSGANQGLTRRDRRQARRDGKKSVLTPEQVQLLSSITGNVSQDIQGGEGFGLDPLAQGAYDNLSRQFGAGSEFGRLGEEAGLKLLRGEQLIPYSDPGREQFYKEAFLDPATANFKNDILPNIQEQYAGRGLEAGRSGDLLNAELTAGRRLATDLGAQRANLLRGDQDRALLGLGQAYGAASTPQEIAFNTGQQNRFLQNQYSNPAYGIAPLALGTQPYATRQRTGGGSNAQLIGSAVGAGLGALGNYYGSQNRGSGGGTSWSSWG